MIKKKIITICLVPCVLFIVFSFGGCGKQDEQPSPEPEKIKSFKIEKKSPGDGSVANEDASGTPDQAESTDAKAAPLPTAETPKELPAEDEATPAVSPEKDELTPVPSPDALAEGAETAPEKSENDQPLAPAYVLIDSEGQNTGLLYNPKGKINPFEPLFRARQEREPEVGRKSQTIRDTRRNKLTPLEKMDISQLKLTAIIMGQQKNIAMVQESTGKGHVISKGTYIGINSGRVIEITKNTVIIEEEVEDLLGKIIVRKRELKLQKPLGDM